MPSIAKKDEDGFYKSPDLETTVQAKVTVPGDWISMVVHDPDIMSTDHIGQWAMEIVRDHANDRRLIWEAESDPKIEEIMKKTGAHFIRSIPRKILDDLNAPAILAMELGKPLPEHYHVLDVELAKKAYAKMCEHVGIGWWEEADAISYDNAIQYALFDKLVYG